AAGIVYQDEVNGIKVKAVQLDDASDPSTGTRDARKLIEQDKVDVLMGAGADRRRAWRRRLLDDFRSAAAAHDGGCGGEADDRGRRQDGGLYRLQRRLGRPR